MECPICLREWDSEQVIPRNLPCGHSYCEDDLKALYQVTDVSSGQGTITCPTCCLEHKFQKASDIN